MKTNDERLEWLLKAAAKAGPGAAVEPPLGLETRVLTQWRAGRAEDDFTSLFAFFRHALVGASLVLALSAVWSLSRPAAGVAGDEATLLNYDIQMSLNR